MLHKDEMLKYLKMFEIEFQLHLHLILVQQILLILSLKHSELVSVPKPTELAGTAFLEKV